MSRDKKYPVVKLPKDFKGTNISLRHMDISNKLSLEELACALYEGTPHIQNLAEKLARQHGKAEALSFYDMMGDDIQNFWKSIAKQIIEHSKHWLENNGSCCVLDDDESQRLKELPRVRD